jgi:hypothetical protein
MSRELLQQALNALLISAPLGHAMEDYEYRHKVIKDIEAELAKPEMPTKIFGPSLEEILNAAGFYRREWVGLTDDDWGQLWQDFEDACDEGEVAYQEEAQKKHGEGHYYISSEDQWEYDKRTIRDLVEAKLKEKNGG